MPTDKNKKMISTYRWQKSTIPRVVRRDHGICHLCDLPGATSADHLIPRSHGGTNDMWNLRACHPRCNSIRGNASVEEGRLRVARALAADSVTGHHILKW